MMQEAIATLEQGLVWYIWTAEEDTGELEHGQSHER